MNIPPEVEPIYEAHLGEGTWKEMDKDSYLRNKKSGLRDTRIVHVIKPNDRPVILQGGGMKVSELQGVKLDYWVALAVGANAKIQFQICHIEKVCGGWMHYSPSTDWSQGGAIIERERIESHYNLYAKTWVVRYFEGNRFTGDTMLIAGMRCFVASKFGEYVPEEGAEK